MSEKLRIKIFVQIFHFNNSRPKKIYKTPFTRVCNSPKLNNDQLNCPHIKIIRS